MHRLLLPEDDAQARYFGLCVFALHDIAVLQELGYLTKPGGEAVIDHDEAHAFMAECSFRGFRYSDEEVTRKGWEFINQWTEAAIQVVVREGDDK